MRWLASSGGGDRIPQLSDRGTVAARSVLIATGVSYRRLTAPGVPELVGAGIYYGASPHDAQERVDQHVFIVGGANWPASRRSISRAMPAK